MRFRLEQRFPAPVEVVEAALVDDAFLQRLGQLPDMGHPQLLEQVTEGDVVRQRVRYRFAGHLSPAVTAVVEPAKLSWVVESVLDRRAHRGEHRIVPDHYPGRLQCSYHTRLEPEGPASTRRVAEGELKVRFPLVGPRVERAIVTGLAHHADAEVEVLRGWLADRG